MFDGELGLKTVSAIAQWLSLRIRTFGDVGSPQLDAPLQTRPRKAESATCDCYNDSYYA